MNVPSDKEDRKTLAKRTYFSLYIAEMWQKYVTCFTKLVSPVYCVNVSRVNRSSTRVALIS